VVIFCVKTAFFGSRQGIEMTAIWAVWAIWAEAGECLRDFRHGKLGRGFKTSRPLPLKRTETPLGRVLDPDPLS